MRRLRLLGPVRLDRVPDLQESDVDPAADKHHSKSIPRFRSQRTVALLGYLVVEGRVVGRDFLAALFWPDEPPSAGRGNLRRELHNLTQILPGCLELDRQTVAFTCPDDLSVDTASLQQLEAAGRWPEAAELLSGEFLEGLHLDDKPDFVNWLLGERERWRGRAETILERVIEGHTRRGRYSDALHYAQKLLQLAPWHEGAHRQAKRLLAWTGQRGAALRQFEICKSALWQELAAEPSRETLALHERTREGVLGLPPQVPTFMTDEGARRQLELSSFAGREAELARRRIQDLAATLPDGAIREQFSTRALRHFNP